MFRRLRVEGQRGAKTDTWARCIAGSCHDVVAKGCHRGGAVGSGSRGLFCLSLILFPPFSRRNQRPEARNQPQGQHRQNQIKRNPHPHKILEAIAAWPINHQARLIANRHRKRR